MAEEEQGIAPTKESPGPQPSRPVSMVVLRYPTMLPDAWLHPHLFPCSVPCVVHYNNTWIEGYRQNRQWLNRSQVLVVYSAMPAAYPEPEWYDLSANPAGLTLMMLNWENWRRHDIVPQRWKHHWWLFRLCQDPVIWQQFHLVSSVERSSLIPFSYHQQYKLYVNLLLGRPPEGPLPEWPAIKRHDALISLMAHHPGYGFDRAGLVKTLMRHMPVHSYGRFLRNMKVRGDGHFNVLSSIRIIARYRFHLALENSVAPDYVTEKVYLALFAGTVPVYAGAPNAGLFVPPQSVILVDMFLSVAALVKYLRCIAGKPELYMHYRNWRNRTAPEWAAWQAAPHPLCQACSLVAHRDPRLANVSLRIPRERDIQAEVRRSHLLQAPLRACL
eukprot:GGOE01001425.1.p1 GENE.GGOE01001425.1~~GGOE01001425.1.p1  ORF type:complete len:431 (+),score=99.79 GGOE01001425.1:138-1295(+)